MAMAAATLLACSGNGGIAAPSTFSKLGHFRIDVQALRGDCPGMPLPVPCCRSVQQYSTTLVQQTLEGESWEAGDAML